MKRHTRKVLIIYKKKSGEKKGAREGDAGKESFEKFKTN